MANRLFPGVAALVVALIAGVVLTGCQDTEGVGAPVRPSGSGSTGPSTAPSEQAPSGSATPSPPASAEPDPTGTGTGGSPPAQGGAKAGEVTVTGAVEAGVEFGCLLLRAPDRTYLLVGGDRSRLQAGAKVTVRGRVEPDVMSTCQQGTPVRVQDIQVA